ncbi:hypothetical protein [Streptomyces sp. TLI_105]|uniref:hypothetical protein n=1 Tax=Streptomyces sp. TLI_105 TaxID=1881019 RepID=UPI000ACF4063
MVAVGGNLYSVPARKVRPYQLVEVKAAKSQVVLHSTTTGDLPTQPRHQPSPGQKTGPLETLLSRAAVTRSVVGRRPLSVCDELIGTRPFTAYPDARETS